MVIHDVSEAFVATRWVRGEKSSNISCLMLDSGELYYLFDSSPNEAEMQHI